MGYPGLQYPTLKQSKEHNDKLFKNCIKSIEKVVIGNEIRSSVTEIIPRTLIRLSKNFQNKIRIDYLFVTIVILVLAGVNRICSWWSKLVILIMNRSEFCFDTGAEVFSTTFECERRISRRKSMHELSQ